MEVEAAAVEPAEVAEEVVVVEEEAEVAAGEVEVAAEAARGLLGRSHFRTRCRTTCSRRAQP